MKAYVFINVAAGKVADVAEKLRGIEGVKSAEICWGLPDIIALAETTDPLTLQDVVLNRIQRIGGVDQTETHLVLER